VLCNNAGGLCSACANAVAVVDKAVSVKAAAVNEAAAFGILKYQHTII